MYYVCRGSVLRLLPVVRELIGALGGCRRVEDLGLRTKEGQSQYPVYASARTTHFNQMYPRRFQGPKLGSKISKT